MKQGADSGPGNTTPAEADVQAPDSILAQWRAANRSASEAERVLYDATMLHAWAQGPQPTHTLREAARRTRQSERDLFNAAMLLFQRKVH